VFISVSGFHVNVKQMVGFVTRVLFVSVVLRNFFGFCL